MDLVDGYCGTPPSQEKVAEIAVSCDPDVIELFLDIIGPAPNVVNKHVLAAAAANELRGEEVMGFLLGRSANTRVTEKVAMAAGEEQVVRETGVGGNVWNAAERVYNNRGSACCSKREPPTREGYLGASFTTSWRR